jgi:hypothetical protein
MKLDDDREKTPWYLPDEGAIQGAVVLVVAWLLGLAFVAIFPKTAQRVETVAERISAADWPSAVDNLDNWLSSLGKEK